mmetsp:Transcript_41108/g.41992  ORF Transcript_41108/g.41992 Transcript_41108/m.41992 type:complete len:358 (-) Transcript_41108:342-1415(-)
MGSSPSACPQTPANNFPESEEARMVDEFVKLGLLNMAPQQSLSFLIFNQLFLKSFKNFLSSIESEIFIGPDVKDELRLRKFEKMDSLCNEFPKYLSSMFFIEWRLTETREIMSQISRGREKLLATLPELTVIKNGNPSSIPLASASLAGDSDYATSVAVEIFSSEFSSVFPNEILPNSTVYIPDSSIIENAIDSCDQHEITPFYKSNEWLLYFIASSELLPIAVTISNISSVNPSFPLIYVNECFELMSGRNRKELIGNPGTFMQTRATVMLPNQLRIIERLSRSVRNGEDWTIASLISSRKNGQQFSNMVGVKPITDMSSNKKYLITIQMEINKCESMRYCRDMIQTMVRAIPSNI